MRKRRPNLNLKFSYLAVWIMYSVNGYEYAIMETTHEESFKIRCTGDRDSVDCDGLIDTLIPTWLNNGVNTMFPIEVGTWDANIKPWREKYSQQLRGVGGMSKYST